MTQPATHYLRYRNDYSGFIQSRSHAIRVARVICIFTMCYVHIHVLALNPTVEALVRDVLGRSSVPLLSVISGVLMVGYFRKPLRVVLKSRFQSLMIPMVTWGLLGAAVYYLLGDLQRLGLNDIVPVWQTGQQMLHLAFLRDLFVLMLATPLLILLFKRLPLMLPVVIATAFLLPLEPVLLRPQILPFYAVGLFWGLYQVSIPRLVSVMLVVLFVIVTIGIVVFGLQGYALDNFLLRPSCAWVFWLVAVAVSRSRLMAMSAKIEPAIFLLFLAHPVLGRVLTGIYSKTGLQVDTLVWLLAPVICLVPVLIAHRIITGALMPHCVRVMLAGK